MGVTAIYTTYRTFKSLIRVIRASWLLFKEVILRGRPFSGFVRENILGFFMLTAILFLLTYVMYLKQSRPIKVEVPLIAARIEELDEATIEKITDENNHRDHQSQLDNKVILRVNPRDDDEAVRDLIKDKLRNE